MQAVICLLTLAVAACHTRASAQDVQRLEIPGIDEAYEIAQLCVASEPSQPALAELARRGTRLVIDLRSAAELGAFDEPAAARSLGLRYVNAGFRTPAELSDAIYAEVRELLRANAGQRILLHGVSADRAAAVWAAALALDEGLAWDSALERARAAGLRSPSYVERTREYVVAARRWVELEAKIRAKFPHVQHLDVEALASTLSSKTGTAPILLDVRASAEYAVSHLLGARRAATRAEALELLTVVAREREIVVYCSVGYRSAALAEELARAGFTNVRNLEGSIFAWANAGHPLYRGEQRVATVHPYDDNWGRLLRRELWSEPRAR